MSRVCELTGVGVLHGNNVSHSNRKTRRVFLPNLQRKRFLSFALGFKLSFRVCASVIKFVDMKGGIDSYLLAASDDKLSKKAIAIRKNLLKQAKKQVAVS